MADENRYVRVYRDYISPRPVFIDIDFKIDFKSKKGYWGFGGDFCERDEEIENFGVIDNATERELELRALSGALQWALKHNPIEDSKIFGREYITLPICVIPCSNEIENNIGVGSIYLDEHGWAQKEIDAFFDFIHEYGKFDKQTVLFFIERRDQRCSYFEEWFDERVKKASDNSQQ